MRGTDFDENQFPLALFCDFLCEEIKKTYGFVLSIKLWTTEYGYIHYLYQALLAEYIRRYRIVVE